MSVKLEGSPPTAEPNIRSPDEPPAPTSGGEGTEAASAPGDEVQATTPPKAPDSLAFRPERAPPAPHGGGGGVASRGTPPTASTSMVSLRSNPAFLDALGRSFAIELDGSLGAGGPGGDVKIGFQPSVLRDWLIESRALERDNRNVGTFAVDFAVAQAWDVVGGTLEHVIYKLAGKDTQWKGLQRFVDDVGQHGIGAFRWEDTGWKDGNFGTMVNTIHGAPHFLASSWFRARGYDPAVAALGGMLTNVLMHEFVFECWEQPKSSHDLLMNSLGAIFGAFPGLHWEVQVSPITGQPTSRFAAVDGDQTYFIAFEQIRDYGAANVPVEQRPLLPWNFSFGGQTSATENIEIGMSCKLVSDENVIDGSVFKAIRDVEIGASLRAHL